MQSSESDKKIRAILLSETIWENEQGTRRQRRTASHARLFFTFRAQWFLH